MRQELAALLSSVQQLRECNPGRKIAEMQGKLVTVPSGPVPGTLRRGGRLVQTGAAPCTGVPRNVHRANYPAGGLPTS